MTLPRLHKSIFLFDLFVILAQCADLNVSGETITTRFWDCCKPSCAWKAKAAFSRPVLSCSIDDKPTDIDAGTGCGAGGSAYSCSNQQPWAINDTLSYGFAGIFLTPDLTGGHVEDNWCCACYQLDFTSDPLKGKSMIVQASNTAYDITTTNRFSLAVPGGNTTSHDACARQYGVDQTVFGETNAGVNSKEDCDNLPEQLRPGCEWRFDWFQDADYPSATFKRVVCPSELTDKTQCTRNDEKALATGESAAHTLSPISTTSRTAILLAIIVGLISI